MGKDEEKGKLEVYVFEEERERVSLYLQGQEARRVIPQKDTGVEILVWGFLIGEVRAGARRE